MEIEDYEDPWMRQFLAGQRAKEDRKRALLWLLIPLAFLLAVFFLVAISGHKP